MAYKNLAWLTLAAFCAITAAAAQSMLSPYILGEERREQDAVYCLDITIAEELAQALNHDMLNQSANVQGQNLYVFKPEHTATKLLESRLENRECKVAAGETTIFPIRLAFDGRFTKDGRIVAGMNVIEVEALLGNDIETIFILTDTPVEGDAN
jgi:hypothetical protein